MKLRRCTFIHAVRELNTALSAQVDHNCSSIELRDYVCVIKVGPKPAVVVPLTNIVSAEELIEEVPQKVSTIHTEASVEVSEQRNGNKRKK